MFRELKKFLSYNKSERRGIFILLSLIFAISLLNLSLPSMISKEGGNDPELIALYDSLMKRRITEDSMKTWLRADTSINYFAFDPNGLSTGKWKMLGLTEKQIEVIKNYEKAGGKFYRKKDLKKIYSISDELYNKLEAYMLIPERKNENKVKRKKGKGVNQQGKTRRLEEKTSYKNKDSSFVLELNTANSKELQMLYGIGPVYADRIIKYRQLLGGFYTKEQLLEVYGFDSTRYLPIENAVFADSNLIRKLRINGDEFRDILRHPYFSYEITKEIFTYRSKGTIKRVETIRQLNSMNDSLFKKIMPYLSLE